MNFILFYLSLLSCASVYLSCLPVNDNIPEFGLENEVRISTPEVFTYHIELQNEQLFLASLDQLVQLKKEYLSNLHEAISLVSNLESEATTILSSPVPNVASGKKVGTATQNDYVSLGTYWWPNPDTDNGLPYIRKDGFRNPETNLYNRDELSSFRSRLQTLSILYFVTENSLYASKAIEYLETWFISSSTKMNPHMRFAQGIPGASEGRFIGLIEGREFIHILDSILLVKSSEHWDSNIEIEIFKWYQDFYSWYKNSDKGKIADKYINNHSSWYDLQLSAFAVATNNPNIAIDVIDSVIVKRINAQIESDGKQTHEITRSKGLQYSAFNLQALVALANLGTSYGLDVWELNSDKETSLVKAIDYLIPFLLKDSEWPYTQIEEYNACSFTTTLNITYEETGVLKFKQAADEIIKIYECDFLY